MKLVKSLLLGSATALVVVSAASAADLGVKKPSAVEYVKVCNTYGAGFFYIPGTNTCIKLGGMVRAEFEVQGTDGKVSGNGKSGVLAGSQGIRTFNTTGYRVQGQIEADVRNATEYGTFRTFVRLMLRNVTGAEFSGTSARLGNSPPATGADEFGKAQMGMDVVAFVQYMGITAGRLGSFYDFYDGSLAGVSGPSTGAASPLGATNLFAYTATFGSGFSATLSMEDPLYKRQNILGGFGAANNTPAISTAGYLSGSSYYGASQIPDVVGNIRVDQAWGSAQLSGVFHEVNTIPVTTFANGVVPTSNQSEAKYGFALQAGVKINLPMLAPGDVFWLQGSYSDGATGYSFYGLGPLGTGNATSGISASNFFFPIADGYMQCTNGGGCDTKLAESFGGIIGLTHYWTPTIRQSVHASYSQIDYGRGSVPTVAGAGGTTINTPSTFKVYEAGTQVYWSPIPGVDIGPELQWYQMKNDGSSAFLGNTTAGNIFSKSSENVYLIHLRMQRTF
jgi:hypothetical protein